MHGRIRSSPRGRFRKPLPGKPHHPSRSEDCRCKCSPQPANRGRGISPVSLRLLARVCGGVRRIPHWFLVGLRKPHPFQAILRALCASVFPIPRLRSWLTIGCRWLIHHACGWGMSNEVLETQRHRGHGVDWSSRTRRKTLPCVRDVFREYSSGGSLQVKRATLSEGQRDFALARSFAVAMSCQQSLAHPISPGTGSLTHATLRATAPKRESRMEASWSGPR
jgi:hypothetical protein